MKNTSEPKAGPSKELFSIKPLEWEHWGDNFLCAETPVGEYQISIVVGVSYILPDKVAKWRKAKDIDEAKTNAQSHFNERIKQCLIKES